MKWSPRQIPPAPLCQRGVRAASPLRKRGVRGDLFLHAVESCHDFRYADSCETLSRGVPLQVPSRSQAPAWECLSAGLCPVFGSESRGLSWSVVIAAIVGV